MKRSSVRFTTFSAFALGLALHVFCIMPYVSGILTDVPPQPYRSWEFLNQMTNYFLIVVWAVGVPLIVILLSDWIYENLGTRTG